MRPQGIDVSGSGRSNAFLASSIDLRASSPSPPVGPERQMKRVSKKTAPRKQTYHPKNQDESNDVSSIQDDPAYLLPMPKRKKSKVVQCQRLEWSHIMTWINFGLIVILSIFVAIYNTHTNAVRSFEKDVSSPPPHSGKIIPFIITTDAIEDTIVKLPTPVEGIRRFDVCCKHKSVIFCQSVPLRGERRKLEIQAHLSMEDNSAHIWVTHPDMVGITCNLYLL